MCESCVAWPKISNRQDNVIQNAPARTLLTSASRGGDKSKLKAVRFDSEVLASHVPMTRRTERRCTPWHETNEGDDECGEISGDKQVAASLRELNSVVRAWAQDLASKAQSTERPEVSRRTARKNTPWNFKFALEAEHVVGSHLRFSHVHDEVSCSRRPGRRCTPFHACSWEDVELDDDDDFDEGIRYCSDLPISKIALMRRHDEAGQAARNNSLSTLVRESELVSTQLMLRVAQMEASTQYGLEEVAVENDDISESDSYDAVGSYDGVGSCGHMPLPRASVLCPGVRRQVLI